MNRDAILTRAAGESEFDLIVIGGGATGLGVAWDAVTRGLSVLLLETGDFCRGTSSRSTKLIHGGLRYLRQGRFALVRESLREKSWLLQQAPDLVHPLRFVIPCRSLPEQFYYRIGTGLYDWLGARPKSQWLSTRKFRSHLPGIEHAGFRGGIGYWDAQFDDCRLAIALVRQIIGAGGLALNYCPVESLCLDQGKVSGVRALDRIGKKKLSFRARAVVNATGVQSDRVRRMADPGLPERIQGSRGSHLVVQGNCLGNSTDALIIPHTPDGRVVFLIPWLGSTLVGTTDVEVTDLNLPPRASAEEVDYLLELASRYLVQPLTRSDVRSTFAGYRPLIAGGSSGPTAELSRDFEVEETAPGLFSVLGGKWTTFRAMAEAAVDRVESFARGKCSLCRTREISIPAPPTPGTQGEALGAFPYVWGDVHQAVQDEMAVTLDDVLGRRLRCLFLDVDQAREIAPAVAEYMRLEKGHGTEWVEAQLKRFEKVAEEHQVPR